MFREKLMKEVLFSQLLSSKLSQTDLDILKYYWKNIEYQPEDMILRQGQAGDGLYFIEDGKVKITSHFPGSSELKLGTLTKGDFFGEVSLMDGGPCTASVIAASPAHCFFLNRTTMNSLRITLPEVAHKLISAIGLYSIKRLRHHFSTLPALLKKVQPTYRNAFAHKNYHILGESRLLKMAAEQQLADTKQLPIFEAFSSFSQDEIRQLSESISTVVVKKNSQLFSQNDILNSLFFIIEGSAQLAYETENMQIKLDVMGPGHFIGALSYFDHAKSGLGCIVREYAKLIIFKYDDLNQLKIKNENLYNKFYYELIKSTVAMLRSVNKQLLRIKCELELSLM